jgi:hypothetical protein
MRHSGVLPDPDLTEYAYALAKADRYQEAIDVLYLLDSLSRLRAASSGAPKELATISNRSQIGRA